MGRILIAIGLVLVGVGALVAVGERLAIRFGRLPGDIVLRGRHATFYFPVVTCLIISLVLTLLSWLLNRH